MQRMKAGFDDEDDDADDTEAERDGCANGFAAYAEPDDDDDDGGDDDDDAAESEFCEYAFAHRSGDSGLDGIKTTALCADGGVCGAMAANLLVRAKVAAAALAALAKLAASDRI